MTKRNIFLVFIALVCSTLIAAGIMLDGTPAIVWWLTNAGGETSIAGDVTMNTSLGQPVIGVSDANGISLAAGFWVGTEQTGLRIFLPQVSR
jgi:hypothetical protein